MRVPALIAGLLSLAMFGCAKPYKVETFKSPAEGVFFTVETYNGGPGPLGTDITKVYAHLERDGKSTRIPVLEGDSLTVSRVIWTSPHDDTICLDGGFTDIFHNQVTLDLGGRRGHSVTIHNRLREHCP